MGRPVNSRYFTSGEGSQIRINAKVGAGAAAAGKILSQRSTNSFRVDVGGVERVCQLVDKATASLLEGEMNVEVLNDANQTVRAVKLYNRQVQLASGVKQKWNFAENLADEAVQVPDPDYGFTRLVITITAQPTYTMAGADATLSVTATSNAPVETPATLTYQWKRNGRNIAGANAATLVVANFNADNKYTVVVGEVDFRADAVTSEVAVAA